MFWQDKFSIQSEGRGTYEITQTLDTMVKGSGVQKGLCHLFVQHTSASLIMSENADPDVRVDLETFMSKICPDGDPMFVHRAEGDDDMPAHIRSVLTQTELTIPVWDGCLAMGTWQGVFLWEHRTHLHNRNIIVSIYGQDNGHGQ